MIDDRDPAWAEHRRRLLSFVRGRVGDEATAEDIVHDVLARAWGRRSSLRDGGRMMPWLYQITRHAIADHYRASGSAEGATEPASDRIAAEPEADDVRARAQLSQCLIPLIDSLPPPYRDAVRLSELHGLTQRETAARLGLSLSGAKSRVQRARRKLRERLLACCEVELDGAGVIRDYEPLDGGCSGGAGCDRRGERASAASATPGPSSD